MAVKKLEGTLPASRRSVAMRSDPTRIDPLKLKLRKSTARHDPRALLLASYLTSKLTAPPASFDPRTKVARSWGMMHANDNGANEVDVLNYWRQTGIAGDQIGAYVALEPSNHTHVMDSVYIFEGCYIGVQLPISAQAQVQNHQPWSVPPGGPTGDGKPGSWGGHAVPVVAYDARGVTVVTWGALQVMTWTFWETYCDEAYAILSTDFINGKKQAPQGFSLTQLQADLADLK